MSCDCRPTHQYCDECRPDLFAPSGQLETGEVTAEQREAARKVHASFADPFAPPCTGRADCNPCFLIARAFAERDTAAERRGAEREREAQQRREAAKNDPQNSPLANALRGK